MDVRYMFGHSTCEERHRSAFVRLHLLSSRDLRSSLPLDSEEEIVSELRFVPLVSLRSKLLVLDKLLKDFNTRRFGHLKGIKLACYILVSCATQRVRRTFVAQIDV